MSVHTTPAYEPETPFEGTLLSETPPPIAHPAPDGVGGRVGLESPFLPEYWTGEEGEAASPATAELVELLERLWDHEFDELTLQLAQEAAAAVDERLPEGEAPGDPVARERFVEGWLEPLHEHAERLLESVGDAVVEQDVATLSEEELDSLLARLEVGPTDLSPTFEGFLGGLLKKAKKLAKGAWRLAKKGIAAVGKVLPIGILLGKLKALVKPLLKRVLSSALGKLPPDLRPVATQLAKRMLGAAGLQPTSEDEDEQSAPPACADIGVIQQELDLAAASLLFASDETDGEIALAELALHTQSTDGEDTLRLTAARERFVAEITQSAGEDSAAAVERFLPAILPVAKMALGVAGRDRVVSFLAGYLAKLIGRYVGPEHSAPLSRAIVDAGLRSINLEAPPESEREAAGTALAATVEDTLHGLAELGEHVFADEELLAHETYRAFEAAAVANMPPATLQPELRPAAFLPATWVLMPAHRSAKAFKKYSSVLDAKITPQVARRLMTFGGTPLETFLREHDGATGTVEARAHLYEAIPGTTLERVAALERTAAAGPDRGDGASIHPLTTEAAGLLFGEPGIGRDVSPRYLSDRDQIAVGQRFVALELVGAPPPPASAARRRGSHARATIDLRAAREIRLALFFSEDEAQRLAAQVNRGGAAAALHAALGAAARPRLAHVLSGRVRRRVRFVADDRVPGYRHKWLRRLTAFVPRLQSTIETWLGRGLSAQPDLRRQFSEAAAKDADGVTVIVRFEQVAGLDAIGKVIRLQSPGVKLKDVAFGPPQRTVVEVVAGFRC